MIFTSYSKPTRVLIWHHSHRVTLKKRYGLLITQQGMHLKFHQGLLAYKRSDSNKVLGASKS